jgi:hypothetical protein
MYLFNLDLPEVAIFKMNYIFVEKHYWHGERYMWSYVNIMHGFSYTAFHKKAIDVRKNDDAQVLIGKRIAFFH